MKRHESRDVVPRRFGLPKGGKNIVRRLPIRLITLAIVCLAMGIGFIIQALVSRVW
jgi:hypothetical protein